MSFKPLISVYCDAEDDYVPSKMISYLKDSKPELFQELVALEKSGIAIKKQTLRRQRRRQEAAEAASVAYAAALNEQRKAEWKMNGFLLQQASQAIYNISNFLYSQKKEHNEDNIEMQSIAASRQNQKSHEAWLQRM